MRKFDAFIGNKARQRGTPDELHQTFKVSETIAAATKYLQVAHKYRIEFSHCFVCGTLIGMNGWPSRPNPVIMSHLWSFNVDRSICEAHKCKYMSYNRLKNVTFCASRNGA